jgi:DNA-binding transcriptional regulator YbjK
MASTSKAPRSSARVGRTLLPLISDTFALRLGAATSQGEAVDAIVSLIRGDLPRSPREQVLTYELYTLAACRGEFRTVTQSWMQASRRALQRHFAADTARAWDVYIEGAALRIALNPDPQSATQTREAITRLIAPSDDQGRPREQDR